MYGGLVYMNQLNSELLPASVPDGGLAYEGRMTGRMGREESKETCLQLMCNSDPPYLLTRPCTDPSPSDAH